MISLLGTAALALAAICAVTATVSWTRVARTAGASRGARRVASWTTNAALAAAACCVALMEWALLSGDFSVAYVAETGNRELPVFYAVTALWAAADGSLLLWLVVLSGFAVLAARRAAPATNPSAQALGMAVLTGLTATFAALTLVGAAPFAPADTVSSDGPGPNPLLQDHPAMGIHPPLLYAGFAGLSVPFAITVGALLAGRVDGAWARHVRPWVLLAWTLLTAGVALGAWWSYAVLGWGGYWAWDPVENVSLMPWLVATALLHLLHLPQRDAGWATAAATMAGAAFLLVVLGTLLTRSGAVLSVHSFSDSPLGPPLLALFAVATVGWAVLLLAGRDRLGSSAGRSDDRTPGTADAALSRQTALRAQVALVVLVTVTVFGGTVLPVLVEAVNGDRLAVGAPWFNRMTGPPALALLVLMAVGPLLAWNADTARAVLRRVRWPAIAALVTIGVVGLMETGSILLPIAGGIAAFAVVSAGLQAAGGASRRRVGALVAHVGLACAAVAVVASGQDSRVQDTVAVGGSVTTGAVSATLVDVERAGDGRRSVAAARVVVGSGGQLLGTVRPELRLYHDHEMVLSSPANLTRAAGAIQVAVLDVDLETSSVTMRLTHTPLLPGLWAGAGVMVIGGLVALVPAPRRLTGRDRQPPPVRRTAEREVV